MIKDPTKLLNLNPSHIKCADEDLSLNNYTGKGLWENPLNSQPPLNKYTYITTGLGGKKMIEDAIDEYFFRKNRREVDLTDKSVSELIDMALNDIDKLK